MSKQDLGMQADEEFVSDNEEDRHDKLHREIQKKNKKNYREKKLTHKGDDNDLQADFIEEPLRKSKDLIDSKVASTPLHKHESQKIHRAVVYEEAKEEANKWDPIVKQNREAPTVDFTKDSYKLKFYISHAERTGWKKPRTEMEKTLSEMLKYDQPVLTKKVKRQIRKQELVAAKQKQAEERKHRELQAQLEGKFRRKKKIKSKKYRKIQRLEKEKKEKQELAELEKTDPVAYEEKLLETKDKERMEERASLKHNGGSHKMKKAAIYGKYDEKQRDMIKEMKEKSRELTEKIHLPESEESEKSEVEEDDDGDDKLALPWLTIVPQRAVPQIVEDDEKSDGSDMVEALKEEEEQQSIKRHADESLEEKAKKKPKLEEADEFDVDALFAGKRTAAVSAILSEELKKEQPKGKNRPTKQQRQKIKLEQEQVEKAVSEEDEEPLLKETFDPLLRKKRSFADLEPKQKKISSSENGKAMPPAVKKVQPFKPPKTVMFDMRKGVPIVSNINDEEEVASDDGEAPHEMDDLDELAAQFEEEKKERAEKERIKDIVNYLPGINFWAGPDYKEDSKRNKKKKAQLTIKAPAQPRKDRFMNNCIISMKPDLTYKQFQPKSLPWQYKNIHQYNYVMKQPTCREFLPESEYRNITRPKVIIPTGQFIQPISTDAIITNKKNKKKKGHKD